MHTASNVNRLQILYTYIHSSIEACDWNLNSIVIPIISDSEVDVSLLRSLVLGGLCTVNTTCKGGKFPLHPLGLTDEDCFGVLSAPKGVVVAKGVTIIVHYAILLSGPFHLPENWQIVSVVLT